LSVRATIVPFAVADTVKGTTVPESARRVSFTVIRAAKGTRDAEMTDVCTVGGSYPLFRNSKFEFEIELPFPLHASRICAFTR